GVADVQDHQSRRVVVPFVAGGRGAGVPVHRSRQDPGAVAQPQGVRGRTRGAAAGEGLSVRYQIIGNPSYSLLEVKLEAGEKVVAESGAMAWMSSNVKAETAARGGFFAGLKRALLSGESFFQNTYTAERGPGEIGLAPGAPGDIVPYEMTKGELLLEK